ncbi:hypothetical protein LBMAG53_15100 [Planctomycetota bacterium]|nr:hypothetical protein LBMAG53_15100 [Planctomycetota bacterium]
MGYIDHEAMVALMSGCSAFVYPSRYEGFGLPPLEAMACGAPVIVFDYPPMPEISGPGALVVPGSGGAEALSAGLVSLLNDSEMSGALRRRGVAHAALYSWESTADATAKVLKEAGG